MTATKLKIGLGNAERVLLDRLLHTKELMSGFLPVSLCPSLSNHVLSHFGLANSPHVSYLVASFAAVL